MTAGDARYNLDALSGPVCPICDHLQDDPRAIVCEECDARLYPSEADLRAMRASAFVDGRALAARLEAALRKEAELRGTDAARANAEKNRADRAEQRVQALTEALAELYEAATSTWDDADIHDDSSYAQQCGYIRADRLARIRDVLAAGTGDPQP